MPGSVGPTISHGLRYDLSAYLAESDSLDAVRTRAMVLDEPRPGDREALGARVEEILAEVEPGPRIGGPLLELAELGADPGRPEVQELLQHVKDLPGDGFRADFTRALGLLGVAGEFPQVKPAMEHQLAHPEEWLTAGCPWGMGMTIRSLWLARDIVDPEPGLTEALAWIEEHMNAAGCLEHRDPLGITANVCGIDHPIARRILLKQIPMLIRCQRPDGSLDAGHGEKTLDAVRALHTHGLLEELATKPGPPADWEVVRSIPAPKGQLWTMAYLDGKLWVKDGEAAEAIGVSPEDGSETARVSLPAGPIGGIGTWGGKLAATHGDPKRVMQVDPDSGEVLREAPLEFLSDMIMAVAEVDGKLWVSDGWYFPGNIVDPDGPAPDDMFASGCRLEAHVAGPLPQDFAVEESGVWHMDFWAPLMLKSGPDASLADWGEKPFGGACGGIAHDGENLWAMDHSTGQISIIRKAGAV